MKILVISDVHLDLPFEPKKYNFLKKIISDCDQVILNGDFWEGQFISFSQFIFSPWKQLFPILKTKKTIYIYGNHDKKIKIDKNVELFSIKQTERYELLISNTKYIFEHGNRLYPFHDETTHPYIPKKSHLIELLEWIVINIFGKPLITLLLFHFNLVIKKKLKNELKKNEIYVCGHTHFAEIDIKNQFINTGFIKQGLGQYLIIDNGTPRLMEEWYD
jgi:predicted phosphodiesterase